VRHGGAVGSCAVLIATGIDANGHRSLLRVSVSSSEADVHWRALLARVPTLFPNEASLLRLVTAVVIEISEE
jgi:transposase-like protein